MEKEKILIFVYGWQKRGGKHNHRMKNAVFVTEAKTAERYTMLASPVYVSVLKKEGPSPIHGEVFAVDEDASNKINLQRGYFMGDRVEQVDLITPGGTRMKAWMHFDSPIGYSTHYVPINNGRFPAARGAWRRIYIHLKGEQSMETPDMTITRIHKYPSSHQLQLKDSEFDKIFWVLSARNRDHQSNTYRKVLVKDRYMVCTDGVRLHMCTAEYDKIRDGVYDVLKASREFIQLKKSTKKYPDVWKIFEGKPFRPFCKGMVCNGDKTPFVRAVYKGAKGYYDVEYLMDMYIDNASVDIDEGEVGSKGSKMLVVSDGERMSALFSMVRRQVTKEVTTYEPWE